MKLKISADQKLLWDRLAEMKCGPEVTEGLLHPGNGRRCCVHKGQPGCRRPTETTSELGELQTSTACTFPLAEELTMTVLRTLLSHSLT